MMDNLDRDFSKLEQQASNGVASGGKRLRILIADDHALIRDALAEVIQANSNHEVLVADSLKEAHDVMRNTPAIDIVLLDLNMPDMEGVRSVEATAKLSGTGAVVLFSGNAPRDVVLQALAKGAKGFIPKSMRLAALLNALGIVAMGEIYLPASTLGSENDPAYSTRRSVGGGAALNEKETEILRFVVAGMSNKEIARRTTSTEVRVKMHMRTLCKKLGVGNRTGAAIKARELGVC